MPTLVHDRPGRHRASPEAPPSVDEAAAVASPNAFRPEVQGLRAIAVGLVVCYHLYPSVLPGGYIGVDVFFVISGFLITGHLARTLARTGRVGLLEFYGRRARRLMPAAALVLAVTWLVARVALPATQLPATATQIRASALYFQNWVLSNDAVDYLKAEAAATPVQHFWSLSVEEQFYLFWPLLFLAAAAVAAVRTAAARPVVFGLAAAVVAASLWFSVHETRVNPAAAYFVTTTRVWELGLGGLLALLPAALTGRLARIGPLAWVGLAAVIGAAIELRGTSPFPGWLALVPVGGAVLLIACGSGAARFGPARLTSTRPMVFLGDISYSLYLWHWPVIVLWKRYSGGGIGYLDGPAIAVLSIVLAWLTKVCVEDAIRLAPIVTRSRVRSLATVLVVAVPVTMVTMFLADQPGRYNGHLDAAHPGSRVLVKGTTPLATPTPAPSSTGFVPPVTRAPDDLELASTGKCQVMQLKVTPIECVFGDTTAPTKTIALVGDSHAGQWSTALDEIGKKQHWKIITDTHNACAWTATMVVQSGHSTPYTTCHDWGARVLHDLVTRIKPDVVITTARTNVGTPSHVPADDTSRARIAAGMVTYWKQLAAHGIAVVGMTETPEMGQDVPDCLSGHGGSVQSCSRPTKAALVQHSPIYYATRALPKAATEIDMNRAICTASTCPAVVGNVIVYRDTNHLTSTYTRSLEPYLAAKLLALPAL